MLKIEPKVLMIIYFPCSGERRITKYDAEKGVGITKYDGSTFFI